MTVVVMGVSDRDSDRRIQRLSVSFPY
jgi:hypothetical protein